MVKHVRLLSAVMVSLALAGGSLRGQAAVGSMLPAPVLTGLAQTKATSIADFAGRAVLYEFFAYTWGPCGTAVAHLNELQEKFAAEGLTVVGVTGAPKAPTEGWIKEKGVTYAYAYDMSGKFSAACGVSGIPHAVLVDVTGKVVFNDHPANLTPEIVQSALGGALKKPLWELPKEFAKVKAAIGKGDLGVALKEAQTLEKAPQPLPEAAAIVTAVQAMIDGGLAGAAALGAKGDWLGAKSEYERIQKVTSGLPAADAAKAKLDEIGKDDAAQKGLKAQKALEPVLAMPNKKPKDKEARKAALEDFVKKNPGTFAATKAQAAIDADTKK